MCNIAGYVGEKRAAPILLEMLRRQQDFDGGVCTGIATIYNGRIYYRKIVGDVDTLIRTTDALTLPGNIGIAHTRPGGNAESYSMAHPFVSYDETMAAVTNGTARGKNVAQKTSELRNMLDELGCVFRDEAYIENPSDATKALKNGAFVSGAAVRMEGVKYYHEKEGMPLTAAMARVDDELYKDGVIEIMDVHTPDRLYVLRTSRPAITLNTNDGMYIATTRFAFPDDAVGEVKQLPVMYPCEIFKDKILIKEEHKMQSEQISEITDYTLEEGYKRIEKMLLGKKDDPVHFDTLELTVWREMRDLFPGDHTLIQDARLVYDVLWRLKCEGRLKMKKLLVARRNIPVEEGDYANDARFIPGQKIRNFMWIDN